MGASSSGRPQLRSERRPFFIETLTQIIDRLRLNIAEEEILGPTEFVEFTFEQQMRTSWYARPTKVKGIQLWLTTDRDSQRHCVPVHLLAVPRFVNLRGLVLNYSALDDTELIALGHGRAPMSKTPPR